MNLHIETLRATRKLLLNSISELTIEQLNEIPHGFNNNIIWNMAHLVAAQQGVCYKRAGIDLTVYESFFELYKPDTKPGKYVPEDEITQIKSLMLSTIDQFEEDYNNKKFLSYTAWTTRYGTALHDIDEALSFLPFHEGVHFGYIMALKRVVNNFRLEG